MRSAQQDYTGKLVTITGLIGSDGSITKRSGVFSVLKTGTGTYVFYFPTLRSITSMTMSLLGAHGWAINAGIPSPTGTTISTYNNSAVAADDAFTFTATGIAK